MPSLQHLGWLQQWWAKTKWIAANPPNEPVFGYNGLPGPCSQCKPSSRSAPTLEGLWVAHLQCNWIFQPACVFALCSLKTKLSPWCLHAANGMELSTGQHIHQIVSNIACLPAYWRHPKKESQCSSSSASSHACMAYKGPGLVPRRCLPALPPHCKWCQLPAPTFWILLVSNLTFSLSSYPKKKKLLGILWAQAGWILCICSLHWHLLHLAHEKRHWHRLQNRLPASPFKDQQCLWAAPSCTMNCKVICICFLACSAGHPAGPWSSRPKSTASTLSHWQNHVQNDFENLWHCQHYLFFPHFTWSSHSAAKEVNKACIDKTMACIGKQNLYRPVLANP